LTAAMFIENKVDTVASRSRHALVVELREYFVPRMNAA
jgi:hypothetical protein